MNKFVLAAVFAAIGHSASAQPTQPSWIADSSTGCRVWIPVQSQDESVSWAGDCRSGVAHGRGVLTANGDRYEGEFVDGKQTGRGVAIFHDGGRYEGDFIDGKRSGRGVMISRDARYDGQVVEGWPDGLGVLAMADGSRLEGVWRDRKFSGRRVVQISANGDRYEEALQDGQPTGWGVKIWANGDRYEGKLIDGKQTGRGVYTWANGSRLEGEWLDGKLTGPGVESWPNGDRYQGDLIDGKQTGRGVYTLAGGIRLEGEWLDGKLIGSGVESWPNGDRYQGDLIDGKQTGRGVYTWASGARIEGEWLDGKFIDPQAKDYNSAESLCAAYDGQAIAVKQGQTSVANCDFFRKAVAHESQAVTTTPFSALATNTRTHPDKLFADLMKEDPNFGNTCSRETPTSYSCPIGDIPVRVVVNPSGTIARWEIFQSLSSPSMQRAVTQGASDSGVDGYTEQGKRMLFDLFAMRLRQLASDGEIYQVRDGSLVTTINNLPGH